MWLCGELCLPKMDKDPSVYPQQYHLLFAWLINGSPPQGLGNAISTDLTNDVSNCQQLPTLLTHKQQLLLHSICSRIPNIHTHTDTYTRAHARTHTHTHTQSTNGKSYTYDQPSIPSSTHASPMMTLTKVSRWAWQNSSTPEASVALKRACLTPGLSQAS